MDHTLLGKQFASYNCNFKYRDYSNKSFVKRVSLRQKILYYMLHLTLMLMHKPIDIVWHSLYPNMDLLKTLISENCSLIKSV